MNPNLIGAIILVTILGAAGGVMTWMGLFDRSGTARLIDVSVTLSNSCPVEDIYFIAYAPESGRTARFSNGVANMRLERGEIIRLAIDPAYAAVRYVGYDEKASRNVALVADCTSSERQNMITRTLREQFGN
ncbi:hypothetical protein [Roseicyclus sp.]|uniref:hypothetical protein n=1 Tax=Roseicyclus sp. TaxID=1914329 RepID=UPI003F6BECF8